MTALDGRPIPVQLQPGITITAPGLVGSAEVRPGEVGGRSAQETSATSDLRDALSGQGFEQQVSVAVTAKEVPAAATNIRAANGRPGLALTVPRTGADQVLMMIDESGAATWHFPLSDPLDPRRVAFVVDRTVPPPSQVAGDDTRGLGGIIGEKLLTVFVLPVLELVVGEVAEHLALRIERTKHPYRMLRLDATGFAADPTPLTSWDGLRDGRALLFLHGTNSSCRGAFSGLAADTFAALHAAYGGRVIGFDHHTLAHDLDQNLAELRGLLPNDGPLEVDVISHSRGGLLARALADSGRRGALPVDVRRVVYVATPNAGTPLADPSHIRDYLDRYTTMLNWIPDGPWSVATDTVSGLLTIVKVVAAGVAGGLPGLTTMDGADDEGILRSLPFPDAEQFAIDVEFEPSGRLLSLLRVGDAVVDNVFSGANDVVVPTATVAAVEGKLNIPGSRHLPLGSRKDVWHSGLFAQSRVSSQLHQWLSTGMGGVG